MYLEEYLKSLNPEKSVQEILFYGKQYHIWREGKYLGQAIWTQDENIGDSFQDNNEVFIADKWELVIDK